MNHLKIYRRYFYKSACYKAATPIKPMGVQVHSTGANNPWLRRYVQPDDGRLGKNAYNNDHNREGNVCAHAYIGKQADGTVAVYQAIPWEQRCWLSGSGSKGNANRLGYIGFEICEDAKNDPEYYRAAMSAAALLTAYLCQRYGIDPENGVRDHKELHDLGIASNHGDIQHWTKLYGETMDTFRGMVLGYMADGVEAEYIDCDEVSIMYNAIAACTGSYLNLRAGKSTSTLSLAQIKKGDTVGVINDADPEWWYVRYKGENGYAMRKYLVPEETAPSPGDKDEPEPQETEPEPEPTVSVSYTKIETIKLKEIEACLADALSIVRAALGREGKPDAAD